MTTQCSIAAIHDRCRAVVKTFDSAIVGTGAIAGFHAAAEARLGRSRIVAATDVDAAALAAFGARWSVPRRYPDLDALLAAESPDLVHLCTPPGLHAAQAVAVPAPWRVRCCARSRRC